MSLASRPRAKTVSAVVSDVDGTLVTSEKQLTARTRAAGLVCKFGQLTKVEIESNAARTEVDQHEDQASRGSDPRSVSAD